MIKIVEKYNFQRLEIWQILWNFKKVIFSKSILKANLNQAFF